MIPIYEWQRSFGWKRHISESHRHVACAVDWNYGNASCRSVVTDDNEFVEEHDRLEGNAEHPYVEMVNLKVFQSIQVCAVELKVEAARAKRRKMKIREIQN